MGFLLQHVEAERRQRRVPGVGGIAAEIEENAPSFAHAFMVHQQVDERGAEIRQLARIERPLITLEKDIGGERRPSR